MECERFALGYSVGGLGVETVVINYRSDMELCYYDDG